MFPNFAARVSLTAIVLAALSFALARHFDPMAPRLQLVLSAMWAIFAFLTLAVALAQRSNLLKGRVKLLTVTLSKVHDVSRTYIIKQGYYTRLGFSTGDLHVKRALLKGNPEPADGTKLTVVLGTDDDWTNVYGWFNHDTGKMYVDFWGGSMVFPWFLYLVTLAMGIESMRYWAVAALGAFIFCFSIWYSRPVYPLFCAKRLLMACVSGKPRE